MSIPRIITYETSEPLRPSERHCACFVETVHVTVNHKRTGETTERLLPVVFYGETAEIARNNAVAFWHDEKAKKAAQAERARSLAKTRGRAA